MPKLTATVKSGPNAPFSVGLGLVRKPMERRVAEFLAEERKMRLEAAATATATSQRAFKYLRPGTEPRPGRSSTGGKLASFVQWAATSGGFVGLGLKKLDSEAPHWIIHEVGTGERAAMRVAGVEARSIVRTVPPQRGRPIPHGLVFASGPSGSYSPPGSTTGQQLQLASRVSGVPAGRGDLRITKEIRGQHFVKQGSEAGFRQYRPSVLAAARSKFRKS